jgi:hypothetical protein
MEWQHERRLVFAVSERWSGWFCERCCWSRAQPVSSEEIKLLAATVQAEFDAHSCEEFAAKNWQEPPRPDFK